MFPNPLEKNPIRSSYINRQTSNATSEDIGSINARKYVFSERVAVAWNSLPPSVVNFTSLRVFRRTIVHANLKLFTN